MDGGPQLLHLRQYKARLYHHETWETVGLLEHQADLLMVFIEEVVYEVGAHRPHPREHQQCRSARGGLQKPAILEQG